MLFFSVKILFVFQPLDKTIQYNHINGVVLVESLMIYQPLITNSWRCVPCFTIYWVTTEVVLAEMYCISLQHFPKQALGCTCLHNKSYENTVGKGEIALNETVKLSRMASNQVTDNQ